MATFNLSAPTAQTTTLSAAITTTVATSLTVTSAAGFPSSGNYDIVIDNEQMTVTSGQGTTTWTVTRGSTSANGTTAATHSNSATVRQTYAVTNAGAISTGAGVATNQIWWSGATYGTNVVVSSYQTSMHVTDSTPTHLCNTNHPINTMYVDSTHMNINGAGSVLNTTLSAPANVAATGVGLQFFFWDASSVATSSATFYTYDGTTDATAMPGVTFQALEQGNASWTAANGSGAALSLGAQSAATFHVFHLATSVSPTSTGAKTGKVKLVLTYV